MTGLRKGARSRMGMSGSASFQRVRKPDRQRGPWQGRPAVARAVCPDSLGSRPWCYCGFSCPGRPRHPCRRRTHRGGTETLQPAGGASQDEVGMVEDFLKFATRTVSVIFKTARRARLTAASVGKAFASSGSSNMRLVPARYRLAYLPRTPPFIEAKSYSGRMSLVDLRLFFFIKPSFVGCGLPGADDPNHFAVLGVRHHQKALAVGHANGQESRLISGMIVIWKRGRERVVQHRRGFVEIDAMLLTIGRGFPRIPSENHRSSIPLSPVTRYQARPRILFQRCAAQLRARVARTHAFGVGGSSCYMYLLYRRARCTK